MRIERKLPTAFLLTRKTLVTFMLLISTAGCGVMAIHEKYGQPYDFDNSRKIRAGMTEEQVIALLGEPYIVGNEQSGDRILKYEWRQVDGQAFMFGLFVMGEKRTVSMNGGETTVTLSTESKTVKKVEYKIVGSENYNRLRGGDDGAIR